jgi:hypothetical protein
MNEPCIYEIRVRGILTERWSAWFEGMEIRMASEGETVLRGPLFDQAALLGVLCRIHSLNLELIAVTQLRSN